MPRGTAFFHTTGEKSGLAGIYAELASLHLAMASSNATPEVQTEHRRRACAYVQDSHTHLNRLPNPQIGFGARYPWSASTAETLRRTAEHCESRGLTPSAHAPVATQGQPYPRADALGGTERL